MALLGARMIADETKQAVETLGATQIKRQGENSVLAKIVQSVSEALEWALTVFAQWDGASGTVKYQINRDFMPAPMDGRELMALVSAVQAGALSDREFFDLMQRGDVVDGTRHVRAASGRDQIAAVDHRCSCRPPSRAKRRLHDPPRTLFQMRLAGSCRHRTVEDVELAPLRPEHARQGQSQLTVGAKGNPAGKAKQRILDALKAQAFKR
jgi:hypothetical protein